MNLWPPAAVLGCVNLFSLTAAPASPPLFRPHAPAAVPDTLMTRAHGTFDVTLSPQPMVHQADGSPLARMSIDKQFHGDLEATSAGEMLAAMTSVANSAGYVAVERITGALHGRRGSFVLQHSGTMTRGAQQLTITVVPDSGTDELVGLTGSMTITIADGKHFYDFAYSLPGAP